MYRARSQLALATLVALLFSLTLDSAAAHGATLGPAVTVSVRDDSRPLSSWSSYWILRRDGQCVDVVSDGIPSYRPRLVAPSRDARPRIVLRKRARPVEVEITSARRLNADGFVITTRRYRPRLEPVRKAGELVAWAAASRIASSSRST